MNNQSTYIGIFALTAIAVFVLIGVVFIQNRRLKEYSQPKYGFLGKPLAFFAIALLAVGTYGLSYYTTHNSQTGETANASQDIQMEVISTETNSISHTFRLNAVPLIDGIAWGADGNTKYDIYWTISYTGGVITEVENGLSLNNPGGLERTLPEGNVKVKATIFLTDQVVEKSIDLTVD